MIPIAVPFEDLENLADEISVEDKVIGQLLALEFLSILTHTDKIIVLMLMGGFKKQEISLVLSVSPSYISKRLHGIRLLSKVLLGNPL